MAIGELLQYVQDAYAALTGLSIIIVDKQGVPVTKVSNMTELAERILFSGQEETSSLLPSLELTKDGWQRPSIVPMGSFGMKSIVAPVIVDGRIEYWIWAGVFVEEETKCFVCEHSVENIDGGPVAVEPVTFPAWTVEATLQEIEKMASVCSGLLNNERRYQQYDHYAARLQSSVTSGPVLVDVNQLFTELFKLDDRIDMALYIKKMPHGWSVLAAKGAKVERLCGKAIDVLFPPLSSSPPFRPTYIQGAALDPRYSFFVRHNIRPKAMIAYPMMYGEMMDGWMVIGSETAFSLPAELSRVGTILVQYWLVLRKCIETDGKIDHHFMRLSMLMEIARAMRVVKNEEEIIRMMVEFAAELGYGDFVCAVWCQGEQLKVVHKGTIDEKTVDCYRDDVHRRYDRNERRKNEVPTLIQVVDKILMEVPFSIDDQRYGVLAVHLREMKMSKEAEVYMTALTVIGMLMIGNAVCRGDDGAIHIDMLSEQLTAREMDVLELLVQGYSNREISERLFISVHTVKNHITNIFQKIGVNDRSQLIALVYQLNRRQSSR